MTRRIGTLPWVRQAARGAQRERVGGDRDALRWDP